ncbi:MAG: DUF309 domain-containing protein [Elusimicrobia bacterium]|nr:DUF309 domain-containing protein [Elusimicrobiota bacterium]
MREVRYLIRLANHSGFTGKDCPSLTQRVLAVVGPGGGKLVNLRVSQYAIEFDLFVEEGQDVQPVLKRLAKQMGPLLTAKRLEPPPPMDHQTVINEARALFNEQRFWEGHEMLEVIWKPAKGRERELVQGLILTAAALVHFQKDQIPVCLSMLQNALDRIGDWSESYYGWDVRTLTLQVRDILATSHITPFTV